MTTNQTAAQLLDLTAILGRTRQIHRGLVALGQARDDLRHARELTAATRRQTAAAELARLESMDQAAQIEYLRRSLIDDAEDGQCAVDVGGIGYVPDVQEWSSTGETYVYHPRMMTAGQIRRTPADELAERAADVHANRLRLARNNAKGVSRLPDTHGEADVAAAEAVVAQLVIAWGEWEPSHRQQALTHLSRYLSCRPCAAAVESVRQSIARLQAEAGI